MTSRRRVLGSGLLAGTGALLFERAPDARPAAAGLQDASEPFPDAVGRADHPAWTFVVVATQDPYQGEVDRLATPTEDTRVVGLEIVIDNASDQPLSFAAVDVRLRTPDGVDYRAGSIVGEEPRLTGRNLKPGERARGWVWVDLPTDEVPSEVVLAGPAPQWRVPLGD